MRSITFAAAAMAAFLMPDFALAKDPPKPPHSRPPERIIGPILREHRPRIGIPPCLVDVKIPCEVIEGAPVRGTAMGGQKINSSPKRKK